MSPRKKLIPLVLLLTFLCPVTLTHASDSPMSNLELKTTYEKAASLMKEERLEEAKLLFLQIIEKKGDFSPAYYYLGLIQFRRADSVGAADYFERAVSLGAKDGVIFYFWATALVQNNDLQKAKEVYKQAIEKKPSMATAHNDLGMLYYRLEEFDNAAACLEKALAIDSSSTKTMLMLGMAHIRNGQPEKAIGLVTSLRDLKDEKKAAHLEGLLRLTQQKRNPVEPDAQQLAPGSAVNGKPGKGPARPPRKPGPAAPQPVAAPQPAVAATAEKTQSQSTSNT